MLNTSLVHRQLKNLSKELVQSYNVFKLHYSSCPVPRPTLFPTLQFTFIQYKKVEEQIKV